MDSCDPTAASLLDEVMMRRALELANEAAALGEAPVGAVVYRGEEILGEGFNRREMDHDPIAHAEILAIQAAARRLNSWRLQGCTMAVTLEPCPMCAGALLNARVDRLIYGATDPKMGCVDTLYRLCTDTRFNHRLTVVSGILAEECGSILTSFFRALREKKK